MACKVRSSKDILCIKNFRIKFSKNDIFTVNLNPVFDGTIERLADVTQSLGCVVCKKLLADSLLV